MKINHSTTIQLDQTITVLDIRKALQDVPDHADLRVEARVTKADRSYETDSTSVALIAEWPDAT